MSRPAVIFEQVSIAFGDRPARALPLMDEGATREEVKAATGQVLGVHDCSLTVAEGEILVLMGLSGSGKSTLLRAVNGLNPVLRGEVSVRHGAEMVSVTRADAKVLRSVRRDSIAMVFQQFGLLPWRSVAENAALGLELAHRPAAEIKARIAAQLDLVGLADSAERKVGELSGGMQQRVGLARAFATDAPILLMDEPFSALDPLIRTRLQDDLLDLQARLKRTILFVSHDLDEAFRIGNRIALMEGGRLIQTGTAREIIANPANQHVSDFIANMNPMTALSAKEAVEPGTTAPGPFLPANMPLRAVMERLASGPDTCAVEEDGIVIGTVSRAGILRRLLNPQGR